jgi:hypothetical protein
MLDDVDVFAVTSLSRPECLLDTQGKSRSPF